MPPTALRERLASLSGGGHTPPHRPRPERHAPPGFEAVPTPHGVAWCLYDMIPVGRLRSSPPPLAHCYFDTETTGLAGGTGTQVFAAATCVPQEAGLEVRQLFLAEPAGEAAFLWLLQRELGRAPRLATYNGASFDLPLVRTRWVLSRLDGEFAHPEHLDLLHLTRALFKQRLESCALHTVEERLLAFERDDDLPGALVPEAYFAYLRHGRSPWLEAALRHNRQDVVSLYYLHARLLEQVGGRSASMAAPDWLALGRHLWRQGRRADAWRALRRAAESGSGAATAGASLLLARELARHRRFAAAEQVLRRVHALRPYDPDLVSARARLLEWRLADLEEAARIVGASLVGLSPHDARRPDLVYRLARLQRRLGRRSRSLPAPVSRPLRARSAETERLWFEAPDFSAPA
ncbi:MAG: ribonuclease H-like domain-containing protein [Candidatus Dormibacteraceae bacterium]